ncbi:MAG: hypothetical protein NT015_08860 [Alphaproteobacteria bacterium]|nr:hypothetical protein [Alphaproteobacteria bacterium]
MSATIELKRNGGDQIAIWLTVAMFVLMVALFVTVGGVLLSEGESVGAFLVVLALPVSGLTAYLYREAIARSFARIAINWQTLELRLPTQRSYVAQEKVEISLPLASIKAIESRAESFRAIGTTAVQFAYSIVLNDGRRIVLGADRRFTSPYYQNAAGVISNNVKIPITNLGLVDGNPGFLLVAGQSVPAWDAVPVSADTMQKRYAQEAQSWRIVTIIAGITLAIGAIARAFGG